MISLQRQDRHSILNQKSGTRRAPRRDRGSHQVTARDEELLQFIAEQYAVTLDQLAVLIGRSQRTARGLRDRWCTAGWTRSAKLAVDLPPFVWLTSRGSSIAGGRFRTWQPNHGMVRHIEAATTVRLLLDRQLRLGRWQCERSLARSTARSWRAHHYAHRPDAVLHTDIATAIEIELTLKSRSRLDTIVGELCAEYQRVWYFAPDRIRHALEQIAPDASPWGNLAIFPYPPQAADLLAATLARQPY